MAEMAVQLADQGPARGGPQADRPVVAARGEERPIGADPHGANPAPVGLDALDGLGRSGRSLPDDDPSVAAAAVGLLAVGREGQREDPGIMPAREDDLLAVREIETRDARALEPAEDEPAPRLEPTADHRPFGRPLGHHMGLLGVESRGDGLGLRHRGVPFRLSEGRFRQDRTCRIILEDGSAIGTSRPSMSNESVESTPTACRYVWKRLP